MSYDALFDSLEQDRMKLGIALAVQAAAIIGIVCMLLRAYWRGRRTP